MTSFLRLISVILVLTGFISCFPLHKGEAMQRTGRMKEASAASGSASSSGGTRREQKRPLSPDSHEEDDLETARKRSAGTSSGSKVEVVDKIIYQKRIKEMFVELQQRTLSSLEIFCIYEEFRAMPEDEPFWKSMVNHGSDSLTDNGDFFPFFKWPCQMTYHQAVGGFLFFPREIDEMEDPAVTLYQRPRVLALLACSASFRNPLALYCLNEDFKLRNGLMPNTISIESGEESEPEEEPSLLAEKAAQLNDFFERTFSQILEALTEAQTTEDLVMKGILSHLHGQPSEALAAFSHPSLMSESFSRSKQGTLVRYYKAVLGRDSAALEQLARENSDHSVRVQIAAALRCANDSSLSSPTEYYALAAGRGSGRGYVGLARLCKENSAISLGPPEALYKKAAEHRVLSAFWTLAGDASKKGAEGMKEALGYYEEAGAKGDPLAYVHLGNLWKTWGDLERAKRYYALAEEAGLLSKALISSEQEALGYVQKARAFFERIYRMVLEG